jgi:SAM-dependent methyltransferase
MSKELINRVNEYYTNKVIEFGRKPEGVDWNGVDSQLNRFNQLSKVFVNDLDTPFSILDFGCGFGSYYKFLNELDVTCTYFGYDISKEMLKNAEIEFPNSDCWLDLIPSNFQVDFVVASGIFNVKLHTDKEEWERYVFNTLAEINKISKKGFSFNILSSYSDIEFMKEYLYYANPEYFFGYCKSHFSKQISLLHDYGLYEFTIIVRK